MRGLFVEFVVCDVFHVPPSLHRKAADLGMFGGAKKQQNSQKLTSFAALAVSSFHKGGSGLFLEEA